MSRNPPIARMRDRQGMMTTSRSPVNPGRDSGRSSG
jgi:hypothetical protein